jgi:hypothetical protein
MALRRRAQNQRRKKQSAGDACDTLCRLGELTYDPVTRSTPFMRKLLSTLLLAVFGFLLVSPLLALGTTSNGKLMACCRRNGKHDCAGAMAERSSAGEQGIRLIAPPERCPFCPTGVVSAHHDLTALAEAEAAFAQLATHPSGVAQTESRLRISRDRSRQKRGPPSNFIL